MLPLMLSLLLFANVLVFASLMLFFGLFGGCRQHCDYPSRDAFKRSAFARIWRMEDNHEPHFDCGG